MTSRIVKFAEKDLKLNLTDGQRSALEEFENGNYSTAVWRCGRRSGKSLLADIICLFDAIMRDDLRESMRPGEWRVSAIICPRIDQAVDHIRNIRALLGQSRRLRSYVQRETTELLELANGSVIRSFPASSRGIRGGAWSCVVLDEFAHFQVGESNVSGESILDAVTPALAQFGDAGWTVAISTPLWQTGAFYELVRQAESGRYPYMQALHRSTLEMNPLVPEDWLDRQRELDPEGYAREFEAQFLDGSGAFLSGADVQKCVRAGQNVLAPIPGLQYTASIDPAYTLDNFALTIGHRDADVIVVDGSWAWKRQGHGAVLDQIAGICQQYGAERVITDQASATPVMEGLRDRGLNPDYQPWSNESKWRAMSTVKLGLSAGTISLPDNRELVGELLQLEARPTPSGLTRIAAAGSGHDDRATALAALVEALSDRGNASAWIQYAATLAARAQTYGDSNHRLPSEPPPRGIWRQRAADAPGLTDLHRVLGYTDPNIVIRPMGGQ